MSLKLSKAVLFKSLKPLVLALFISEYIGSSLSTLVVPVQEQRDRFWPVILLPDAPNHFQDILTTTSRSSSDRPAEFSIKPTLNFRTKSGKNVVVFDDVLDYKQMAVWRQYMHMVGYWRFQTSDSGIPWTTTFDVAMFSTSESGRRLLNLINSSIPPKSGEETFVPYEVTCNILRRGDSVHVQRGEGQDEFTVLLYLNQLWRKNDYGELLFYDEGDLTAAVTPKFNRAVVWDSGIDYLTRPPCVSSQYSQFLVTARYTLNRTKAEHYQQARAAVAANQQRADAELYRGMEGSILAKDIQEHVTKEFTSKSGKKIFVFDDLFNPSDLDKLRLYTLKYGKYYFDDSIVLDSDNVQWIAAFDIDRFVESKLWHVVQLVAHYVSGSNEWFPYDISCNLVRSFDHTQIHEDCEKQEDEWTFLVYLTPNWTADYYGETVFIERNADNAENIASVLPRYGRVTIFQGIIPHSARPPSTVYTEPRLSFAVKLSANPWLARKKMMRQEFSHEEGMHQLVLSLLKQYKDPLFERRYKQALLRSAEEAHEIETSQGKEYLRSLHKMVYHGNVDVDEEDEMEDDNEEYEFDEDHPRDDESEFEEINRRKKYIYDLPRTLGSDAASLANHYRQFIKDRTAMEDGYKAILEELL